MKKLQITSVPRINIVMLSIALLISGFLSLAAVSPAFAQCGDNSACGAGDPASGQTGATSSSTSSTPIPANPDCNDPSASGLQNCLKHNKLITDLNDIVDFLSAGVGIVVVGSIILGGIQYSMANGSPDATAKAKQRISNALIALVAFFFIFAFLQWIIPGGL